MAMHKVWFTAVRRMVEAHDGENLLQLARRAGILLDSSCGGNGSCHQCRVILHDTPVAGTPAGAAHFQNTQGQPVAPQHKRGNQPVWLACRGVVKGALNVEAAPVHEVGGAPAASLVGWQVGPGGGAGMARVHDPHHGQTLVIDRASGTIVDQPWGQDGEIHIGREISRDHALALGAGQPAALILDLSGRAVLGAPGGAMSREVDMTALRGEMGELPGAIRWVQWLPMKTRTVLETVSDARPAGLAASGLIACLAALLQAGMADAAGNLRPSRFVRDGGHGPELVLVGPNMEAITPGGAIWTSEREIVLSQARLQDAMRGMGRLRDAGSLLSPTPQARQVLTGPPGVMLTPQQVELLGFGGAVFIPDAAGLGAARWACAIVSGP